MSNHGLWARWQALPTEHRLLAGATLVGLASGQIVHGNPHSEIVKAVTAAITKEEQEIANLGPRTRHAESEHQS